jgi:hypothetical protein
MWKGAVFTKYDIQDIQKYTAKFSKVETQTGNINFYVQIATG